MAWDLQNMSEANGYCKPMKHKNGVFSDLCLSWGLLLSQTMGNNDQTIRIFLDTIGWF
jgi:hypothetical protein